VTVSDSGLDSVELDEMDRESVVLLAMTGDTSVLFGAKLDEALGSTRLSLGTPVERDGAELVTEPGYDGG